MPNFQNLAYLIIRLIVLEPLNLDLLTVKSFHHIIFWFLSMLALAIFFADSSTPVFSWLNWIYTFLFHLSLLWVVYWNWLVAVPYFLQKRKYVLYGIIAALFLITGIGINIYTFSHLSNYLFPGYFFISYYEWKSILVFLGAYWLISTLLELSKAWFQLAENKKRMQELEKKKLDAELKALKSQINPHFLFNSLNNLYGLAMENSPQTSGLLLKLSESMRYMLYDSNEVYVPLENEMAYLQNYLELQRLRLEEANISFEITGEPTGKKIAPLLFIPFVENAFKHGLKGDTENVFVHIHLRIEKEAVIFQIENNKGEVDAFLKNKEKGIGLENVKKRLELLYKGQYELEILNGAQVFEVVLKILA